MFSKLSNLHMLGLALILIIGPGKTTAQDKVYVFNRLNTDNDLTSGQYNYYVYQDSYGLVWISSTKGLNRFDGTSVKQFHANPDDPCSLLTQNGAQSRFQEDRRGDLWFAADIGLTHYLRTQDRFEHHYLIAPGEDTLRDYYFWAYLDTLANQMFVSGGRQLFSIDLNASKLDLHNRIDTIYVGLKDRMIPAPQGGYYLFRHGRSRDVLEVRHYNSNALMRPPTRYRLPGNARLNDTKYINDTLVWVATSNGLYQLNLRDSGWTTIPGTYRGKKIDGITELVMRKNGQILVATYDQGIYYFDPLSKRYTGRMLSFQQERIEHFSPIIDRVTLDRKENLWISTKDNGIYYTHLDKPKFGIDLAGRGSNGSSVKYLTESKDSAVWVMLPKRVARLTSRDTLYYSLPVTGTGVEQTTFLHEDQQGRVWAGTLSKLFVLFPGTSTFRPVDLLPPGATDKAPGYNALTEFPNGDLLIATNILFPLIIKADLTESRWLDMSIARPRYLYKGVGQEFFIHTFLGVFYIGELDQSDSYKIDTTFRQLSFLTAIQWDADRQLYWVGTSNGLFRLRHTDTGWSFQKEDHFDFNLLVSGLLLDNAGKLWMSIPGNLMAYDPDSLRYDLYHKADGLQGPDYNDMAVLQHSDGRFFFGGTNGITVFRPQNIDSEIPLARPAIVNIKINQEEDLAYQFSHNRVGNIMEIRQLKLPYTLNNLTFTAAPMEYSDPQNCRFSYQLKGSTTDAFIENGNNPQIAFSRLSPGKYELNIRSTNSDGVVSESTDPIHIEILPPWYQTSWFYLLAILAIIGIVFLIIRNRFREAMRRQTLAQEVSEARRKAAEAQRNEAEAKRLAAETETAVLRLQMDPHFIFNSMNAIDAFILQGEKLRAHDYLVYFSELMRGILNNSEKTYTNLEDEIDLLKKYLQVEQMRIGPRLTYTVLPAPEVDTYETEIPTMILQPFVENAIWHGISPKSGPGHIRINFFQKEDLLICEVLDDGVGRGYTSRAKPHKSKATKITERRLALLPANKDGRSAQFEIIDEQDQSGQPCGTSVRFFFPLTQPANTP